MKTRENTIKRFRIMPQGSIASRRDDCVACNHHGWRTAILTPSGPVSCRSTVKDCSPDVCQYTHVEQPTQQCARAIPAGAARCRILPRLTHPQRSAIANAATTVCPSMKDSSVLHSSYCIRYADLTLRSSAWEGGQGQKTNVCMRTLWPPTLCL